MCPRFKSITQKKKKKIKPSWGSMFPCNRKISKIIWKKEKMHYMTREETEVLSAKARLQWRPRRPRSLPYIPNAYKQPGRATKSSLNSYDSKQTNWDSIWAELLVCFHPNTAAETLLKISVSSWVLRRCDWDKGGSVTSCSKAWC